MRERELLARIVEADGLCTVGCSHEAYNAAFAERKSAIDSARDELARQVPSVAEAWAVYEHAAVAWHCSHSLTFEGAFAAETKMDGAVKSYADAVAAAAVERHRAVLAELLEAAKHMAHTAEGYEDWGMYNRAVEDAEALLADAQKGSGT